jgi:hypothetical protein
MRFFAVLAIAAAVSLTKRGGNKQMSAKGGENDDKAPMGGNPNKGGEDDKASIKGG